MRSFMLLGDVGAGRAGGAGGAGGGGSGQDIIIQFSIEILRLSADGAIYELSVLILKDGLAQHCMQMVFPAFILSQSVLLKSVFQQLT